tara:strand:- start:74 stop:262 length:189 start_codon:yes stop_codon:yes gene_type:complete
MYQRYKAKKLLNGYWGIFRGKELIEGTEDYYWEVKMRACRMSGRWHSEQAEKFREWHDKLEA